MSTYFRQIFLVLLCVISFVGVHAEILKPITIPYLDNLPFTSDPVWLTFQNQSSAACSIQYALKNQKSHLYQIDLNQGSDWVVASPNMEFITFTCENEGGAKVWVASLTRKHWLIYHDQLEFKQNTSAHFALCAAGIGYFAYYNLIDRRA